MDESRMNPKCVQLASECHNTDTDFNKNLQP